MDAGFMTPTLCGAQMPSEAIFTPEGWINVQGALARKQYLPFRPGPDDTIRALRVISKGCANGSPAGPVCDSITRVALLSDKARPRLRRSSNIPRRLPGRTATGPRPHART
jgi:hypothetical protein